MLKYTVNQNFKSCIVKGTVKTMKREAIDWEKISVNVILDKRLVLRIYNELPKLNSEKGTNVVKK